MTADPITVTGDLLAVTALERSASAKPPQTESACCRF